MPALKMPKTRTEGLQNFVAMILNEVKAGNTAAAETLLVDLQQDIGLAYVCQEDPTPHKFSMPEYDPKTDGDYHSWLIAHNID